MCMNIDGLIKDKSPYVCNFEASTIMPLYFNNILNIAIKLLTAVHLSCNCYRNTMNESTFKCITTLTKHLLLKLKRSIL